MSARRFRVTRIPEGVTVRVDGNLIVKVGDIVTARGVLTVSNDDGSIGLPFAAIEFEALDMREGDRIEGPRIVPAFTVEPPAPDLPRLTEEEIAEIEAQIGRAERAVVDIRARLREQHESHMKDQEREDAERWEEGTRRVGGWLREALAHRSGLSVATSLIAELRTVKRERDEARTRVAVLEAENVAREKIGADVMRHFLEGVSGESGDYVDRRRTVAESAADALIERLTGPTSGLCICDDMSDAARTMIVDAIEGAMVKECETT